MPLWYSAEDEAIAPFCRLRFTFTFTISKMLKSTFRRCTNDLNRTFFRDRLIIRHNILFPFRANTLYTSISPANRGVIKVLINLGLINWTQCGE
jgi:hypothetical protein